MNRLEDFPFQKKTNLLKKKLAQLGWGPKQISTSAPSPLPVEPEPLPALYLTNNPLGDVVSVGKPKQTC